MSVFGSIMSSIFGSKAPAATPGATPGKPGTPTAAGTPAAGGKPGTGVDVEAVLVKMSDDADEDLNWRQSIVDLMKLLKLDSSLSARKELAQELGYKGALNGSAEMNIWLHKQVMDKLAESGGVVPESLRHK